MRNGCIAYGNCPLGLLANLDSSRGDVVPSKVCSAGFSLMWPDAPANLGKVVSADAVLARFVSVMAVHSPAL